VYPARWTVFGQIQEEKPKTESDPMKEIQRIIEKLQWGETLYLYFVPGIKIFSSISMKRLEEFQKFCNVIGIEDCKTDEEYIIVKIDNKVLEEFYHDLRDKYSIPNWKIGNLHCIEISSHIFRVTINIGVHHPTLTEFQEIVKQARKVAKVFGREIHEFYIERRMYNYVRFS